MPKQKNEIPIYLRSVIPSYNLDKIFMQPIKLGLVIPILGDFFSRNQRQVIKESKPNSNVISKDSNKPWMVIAKREEMKGVKEVPDSMANPDILKYLKTTTYPNPASDELGWCAAFVNYCITQARLKGKNSAAADDWKTWGQQVNLDSPSYGCVAVIQHIDGNEHVGFVVRKDGENIFLLGGNQSNTINESPLRSSDTILAYRYPSEYVPVNEDRL